jgi:CheY-like chemotaxis protein
MSDRPAPASANVLLVDDDAGDELMIREALAQCRAQCRLHRVSGAEQALRFLRRGPGFEQAPRPALILLDLSMPGPTGLDALAAIRADDALRAIPVVILSTSRAPDDVRRSYELSASAYIVKPVDFDSLAAVVREIDTFIGIEPPPAAQPGA